MSFLREPNYTGYNSDIKTNMLQTPEKYLQSDPKLVTPWFQPNRDYNYYMINSNEIVDNKRYRKYMTTHNKEIIEFNNNLYKKQWNLR
jgi:hypothetical protein